MDIKQDFIYKGTRILFDDRVKLKRTFIDFCVGMLNESGFNEIYIPIIQFQSTFEKKIGNENNQMMFSFKDRGNRDLCLAPEYTAIIQQLANTQFKFQKDVKLFYVVECFRGEKPQRGRYRQFTQLGVEIINPTKDYINELIDLACKMILIKTDKIKLNKEVTRGLDYYKDGKGFEIEIESLGAQKQVCGGGEYQGGIGFAIGIDRLLEV